VAACYIGIASAEDDRFGDKDYSGEAFGASTALSAAFAIDDL